MHLTEIDREFQHLLALVHSQSQAYSGVLPGLNKSLLALTALAAPLATYAQQATERGEEPEVIDVTGSADRYNVGTSANSKFTRPLLDTPQTVQVISKVMLQEQGSISLMDALRNTPGITMQLGENGNTSAGDTFQMRGFATASSTFVDGLRDLGAVSRDVFNLEQVEVAKGPSARMSDAARRRVT